MKYSILCILLFYSGLLAAQLGQMPLSKSFNDYFAQPMQRQPHSAVLPYNPFEASAIVDSVKATYHIENNFTQTWLGRKLFNENMANVEKEDFKFILNPLFNLRLGSDNLSEEQLFTNTRGIQVSAQLGDNFYFYSDIYENQARFPNYVEQFIQQTSVVPGLGDPKPAQEVNDYSYVNGFFTFQANKFLNFQFGYGKNFFGDGYRSLLLSDNAFNYPYLRVTTDFWKIRYVNLFTQMLDINTLGRDQTFTRKYVTSHYLSAEVTKKLTLSLFETVIYHDSTGTRGYDINYLNPFILYRPIEFAIGSLGGNVLIGGGFKYQFTDNFYIYGQGLVDEVLFEELFGGRGWWGNKFSLQGGFKSFNTFIPGLLIQSEINFSRPYTYTHRTELQNYGHYNQALAHPLGANFIESISVLRYMNNRWFGEVTLMYAQQGLDPEDQNWGSDIYLRYGTRESNINNEVLQGIKTDILLADIKVGYIVNPNTNWRFELGYTYRSFSPEEETSTITANTTHYFHVGIVTSLGNQYLEF